MKYIALDAEEKKLLASFENDELIPVSSFTNERKRHMDIAEATLGRTRQINIRISEKVLQKLKSRAAEKGLPYQTLISSVLHQYSVSA